MKRAPGPPKEQKPPREKPTMTLREWWVSMRPYEGQHAKPRPAWLEVPK
jgi:hypothetical protein